MPIIFETVIKNEDEKNKALAGEIEMQESVIMPNIDLDGSDVISLRITNEQDTITQLKSLVKEQENREERDKLLKEIEDHQEEILKLKYNREIAIPQSISRLKMLQTAEVANLNVLTIKSDTKGDEIDTLLQIIEERLAKTTEESEKRVLTDIQGKLVGAKTAMDTGKSFPDIKIYLHDSELRYFSNIEKSNIISSPDGTLESLSVLGSVLYELEKEQDRVIKENSRHQDKFNEPITVISEQMRDIKNAKILPNNVERIDKSLNTIAALYRNIENEKQVSPSFKDKLRSKTAQLHTFLNKKFGLKLIEPSFLKSKTLTNAFQIQQHAQNLSKAIDNPSTSPSKDPSRSIKKN